MAHLGISLCYGVHLGDIIVKDRAIHEDALNTATPI